MRRLFTTSSALFALLLIFNITGHAQTVQTTSIGPHQGGGSVLIDRFGGVRIKARSDKAINLDTATNVNALLTASTLRVTATGTTFTFFKTFSASLDFTALAANTCEVLTITATGTLDGDRVFLGVPTALADVDGATESTTFFGWISAPGVVSVRRCNPTAVVTANPAAATVSVTVLR